MWKYTLTVNGMRCGMCEAHMNDAIRKAFPVKKVTSSHSKNEVVIVTEEDIEEQQIKDIVDATGYEMASFSKEPWKKKGLFGR